MSQVAHIGREPARGKYFGPAEVLSTEPADGGARVRYRVFGETYDAWARTAVPGTAALATGDEVLIAGESAEQLFVIGILASSASNPLHASEAPTAVTEIRTAAGAHARLEDHGSAQRLRVYSERNELLFDYDPASSTATLSMARGNLELETREGDIRFKSARNVLFEGQEIELAARSGIRLDVVDALRKTTSSLALGLHRLKAAAAQMTLDAGRARLNMEETRYTGKRLLSTVAYTQLVADKCETVTRVLVEKSQNAYRTVEQLAQTKAGRMRTLIAETYQMNAGKAFLKSRQDFKIKADKIHLG